MAWHLITQGDDQNSNYMEFLLDSASDINSPPSNYSYAPSSLLTLPGMRRCGSLTRAGTGWRLEEMNNGWFDFRRGNCADEENPER